jgi:hypothetical protein
MNNPLRIDNSKRSTFVACPRKYYWQYIRHLRTRYGSSALRYGSTWHAGLDAFYKHIADNGWTRDGKALQAAGTAMKECWDTTTEASGQVFYEDYRTLSNCFNALIQYMDRFAQDEGFLEVIRTETPFMIPISPDEREHELFPFLEPFLFTGVIDGEIYLNDRFWILEHKTTGQPLVTQIGRLHRSAQILGYSWAASTWSENPPEGAMINMHHLSAYKSKTTGSYGVPKMEFQRSPQIFSPRDLEQWRMSFLSNAQDIQREHRRHIFPMCHDACYQYGNCPFIMLCEQNRPVEDTIIPDTHFFEGAEWDPAKNLGVV